MKDLNNFLYGPDYTKKQSDFKARVADLEKSYSGNFETDQPYFSLINLPQNQVQLRFDEDKDIPADLKNEIQTVFKEVWK